MLAIETEKMREWLTAARKHKGHTLKSLADLAGVSPSFLCKVEKGEKNPGGRVAKVLSAELKFPMEKFWP